MFLAFMKGVVLRCSEECRVMLDWLRVSDLRLVLDGVEDLIDESLNRVKGNSLRFLIFSININILF